MRVLVMKLTIVTLLHVSTLAMADLTDAPNYREYSERLSSSGQPSEEQLQDAWADDFERVIYLAFSDHETSIEHEDRIVKDLEMEYLHIPVVWSNPTRIDFYLFAAAMQQQPTTKTLVHCEANFRASVFSFLYRVIYEHVPLEKAKADLNSVWTPNGVWTTFALDLLTENSIDAKCESCDWTPQEM